MIIGWLLVGSLAVLLVLAMTGALIPVIVWTLGPTFVEQVTTWGTVAIIVAAVLGMTYYAQSRDVIRMRFRPDPSNPDHALAAAHEGRGHAAVGYGIRRSAWGIRAKINPDGSGECTVPRRGLSLAESLAITHGGEDAAGPVGCSSDQARFKRDLRRSPKRYRDNVKAEALALSRRHHSNSFGARVERALLARGRW
jgi:hypothetical protein